jgi:hypothetical protein
MKIGATGSGKEMYSLIIVHWAAAAAELISSDRYFLIPIAT